ncbi:hypothetical protein Hanom_Chr05g00453241 [Helianthus anomalus]
MVGLGLGLGFSFLIYIYIYIYIYIFITIHSPPCQLAPPPHARLETQAPRATPQPKPTRGGGLGVFPQPTPHTPWP